MAKTIVTHNGKFHADDVFSVATLSLVHAGEKISVVRTRDPNHIETADIVVDVGAVYDPVRARFDHHQEGGAGFRQNGIPFAAFGLVWKAYGEIVCRDAEMATAIDASFVAPIDADDNGFSIAEWKYGTVPYTVSDIVGLSVPTWKETDRTFDEGFAEAVVWATDILRRVIKKTYDRFEARARVRKMFERATDKRLILLDGYYPWQEAIQQEVEPLYVVYPSDDTWRVMAVPKDRIGFDVRKPLPEAWAGKRDRELQATTGVSDAVFCHNGRHLAVAKSKTGALKLAELALRQ